MTSHTFPLPSAVRQHGRRLLVAVVCTSVLWSMPAAALDDLAARVAAQEKATQEYKLLLLDAAGTNNPAKLDESHAQALVRRIADRKQLLDEVQYQPEDFVRLQGVCGNVSSTVKSLMMSGVATPTPEGVPLDEHLKKAADQVNQNMVRHESEMAQLLPFMLRCITPQVTLAAKHFQTLRIVEITQIRLGGLQQARDGYTTMFAGSLKVIDDGDDTPELRSALISAMVDSAPALAKLLKVTQRAPMARSIRATAARLDKEQRTALEQVAAVFDDTRCEDLCTY